MLYYLTFNVIISYMKGASKEKLNARIRRLRKGAKLTQNDVAAALQINRVAVVSIEAGKRKVSADEVLILCELFGCSTDELLLGVHEEDSPFLKAFMALDKKDRKEVMEWIEFKLQKGKGRVVA